MMRTWRNVENQEKWKLSALLQLVAGVAGRRREKMRKERLKQVENGGDWKDAG